MTDHHTGRREPPPAARTPRARRTSLVGRLAALAVAAGVALSLGTAGAAAGSAAVPVAAAKAGLDIQLSRVSPAAVGPTTPLAVTVAVRNTSGAALRKPTVTLRLHQGLLDGREGVDDWIADGAVSAVDRELGRTKLKTLAPGQSATVTISVEAGGLGLGTLSSFGPRGIAIDASAGGRNVGALRSTFVWMPGEPDVRTRLSLAVPLTEATPSAVAGSATEDAARSLEPGGHLDRVLTATEDKAVAWAVDPAVLAAAQRLSTDGVTTDDELPTATGTDDPDATTGSSSSPSSSPSSSSSSSSASAGSAGDPAAAGWLDRFKTGARNRGLIGLPYADPDLTAILRARESVPLLTGADELGRSAAADAAGVRLDNSIAWPAGGRINTVTASRLAGNGRTAVILSAATQRPEAALTTTPTGRGTVETKGGSLDSLLYDDQLSALFAASGTAAGAQATQTFLAELAAITRESDTVRHLLAVAPRAWEPEPAGVQTLLTALRAAPWVSLRGINDLRSTEPAVDRTGVKYGTRAKNAELPIGHVSYMLALHRGLTTFAPALDVDDPEATPEDKKLRKQADAVVQAHRESIASMLSVAWRGDRQQLAATRSSVGDEVNDLVDGVRLRGGGGTLTGKSASLPLYVDNRTPYPVRVKLQLKPGSGQVAFANDLVITVPPRQLLLPVQVPTRSLANGNVQVEARLLTDEGGQVGSSLVFTVKVRPSWETVGMIVVGSVLGLLFVLGLLRSVRRGRRRTRVHPDNVPDVDDLASERADAADAAADAAEGDPGADPGIGSTDGLSHPEPEPVEPSAGSGATRSPVTPRETR